jgi:hypothetical protein
MSRYNKNKYNTTNKGTVSVPVVKLLINLATAGIGGTALEIIENQSRKEFETNIEKFIKDINLKIKRLENIISEEQLKKNAKTPEFTQVFVKILDRMKIESREKIREAYSVALINIIKEEIKIDFNQKLYFVEILDSINEDQIKILAVFYDFNEEFQKNYFSLDALFEKLGCYIERERRKGDQMSLWDDKMITVLDSSRTAYIESLLSILDSKKLIKIEPKAESEPEIIKNKNNNISEIESISTTLTDEYTGTELGYYFLKFITEN